MQGEWIFWSQAGNRFRSDLEDFDFQDGQLPLPESTSPEKFVGGGGV